jgi:hypothetical protein
MSRLPLMLSWDDNGELQNRKAPPSGEAHGSYNPDMWQSSISRDVH